MYQYVCTQGGCNTMKIHPHLWADASNDYVARDHLLPFLPVLFPELGEFPLHLLVHIGGAILVPYPQVVGQNRDLQVAPHLRRKTEEKHH